MANTLHEKPKYVVMMDHDNNSKKVKNFMILLYNFKKCKNTNLSACNHGHLGCQDFLVFIRVNGLLDNRGFNSHLRFSDHSEPMLGPFT